MENKKILYVAQEISPYLPSNELTDTGRDLPQAIIEKGYEVRTFMPKYGNINERRNQLHEVIRLSGLNIVIDDTDHQLIIKVATFLPSRMQVYFIDNEDYFQHHGVSDIEIREIPADNDERAIFYVRGVVETVKKLRWEPSIVHCVGWISSLAPLYLRRIYDEDPSFRNSKIVVSLVNDHFDGALNERFIEKLKLDGIPAKDLSELESAPVDYTSLLRLAIRHADGVAVTMDNVDPSLIAYAESIGKPLLKRDSDGNSAQSYIDFYQSL